MNPFEAFRKTAVLAQTDTRAAEQQYREAVANQSLCNLGVDVGAKTASNAQPAQDPRFFDRLHAGLDEMVKRARQEHDRLLVICNRVGVLGQVKTDEFGGFTDNPTSDIEVAESQLRQLVDAMKRIERVVDDLERNL